MIRLIVFDVNGILYSSKEAKEYFSSAYFAFMKRHNVDERERDELWDGLLPLIKTGRLTLNEARKQLLEKLGLDKKCIEEYNAIDDESYKRVKLMEPDEPFVFEKLKEKGCALAALSDSLHPSERIRKELNFVGLGNIIEKVFATNELGHPKPEKAAYDAVLDFFNAKPSETIFVGHDDDEMEGAKRLGIIAVSYSGSKKGDFLINSFPELIAIIDKLLERSKEH